jgi:rod shape determining protein RodA
MSSYKVRWFKDLDVFLILVVIALCAISLLAISSATHSMEGGSNSYVIKQLVWSVVGFGVMIYLIRTDYRNMIRYIEIAYWVSIALLIAVFFFEPIKGAHGWIPLGSFALQPSEFFKVVFVLMMAKYLANEQEDEEGRRADPVRNYLFLGVYAVLAIGLIVIEPDLGQTMMMMSIVAAAMFVHLPPKIFWTLAAIAAVILGIVVTAIFLYPDQFLTLLDLLVHKGFLAQHQYDRFETFIYPERDLGGLGYQVYQAKVAIGSGQMFGKGLYQGSQTQGSWVPEQQTDFIFTVIGEELGFVGSVAVIFLFFLMIYRIVANGLQAGDRTGMYICSMVAGMFTLQIFENIGMSLQLMPMTGVTLPFISYGGSSVLTNFMLIGIVLNIGLRRRKLSFVS